MKPIIFRPAAAADVEDAYRWYESRQAGLGEEFLATVAAAVRSVQESPARYPVIHRLTRRSLLTRFPYGLYYRILDDHIVVVACMHARRNPKRWQFRR